MEMDGEQFVSILTKEFGLQLGAVTKNQWKGKKAITARILRNAFHKFERQRLTQAIEPIVEFHHLNFEHDNNMDTFAKRIDNKTHLDKLKNTTGIYAFFKSEGSLVYVGKS